MDNKQDNDNFDNQLNLSDEDMLEFFSDIIEFPENEYLAGSSRDCGKVMTV